MYVFSKDMFKVLLKTIVLAIGLVAICIALSGCGNTVKGIGTDIVKMGDNIMKEEPKNEVSK
mgnify:CR=1 FL=1|tara:strand:- start:820 stop:1005 length:186 start_codon:yes stop_codon:yes gene_type:complete